MKRLLFTFVALLSFVISNAQIGYQVALLNTATGEPRSNETVTCEIKLTNSEDAVVYEDKKKATSNDFGVVSLTVGDANTFSEMDWSKLPLTISVSVEGRLVGQTEVLTVPVAEHAKHYGTLTYENIGEKKVISYSDTFMNQNWTFTGENVIFQQGSDSVMTGKVRIDGNSVFGIVRHARYTHPFIGHYSPEDDTIYILKPRNFY